MLPHTKLPCHWTVPTAVHSFQHTHIEDTDVTIWDSPTNCQSMVKVNTYACNCHWLNSYQSAILHAAFIVSATKLHTLQSQWVFNAQSTVSVISGRNTIHLITSKGLSFTQLDILQSLFGEMKQNEPERHKLGQMPWQQTKHVMQGYIPTPGLKRWNL